MAGLDRPKVKRSAPAILAPVEMSRLLHAATPEILPSLILQAFCGLRRAEADRMEWKHIHLTGPEPYIEIPSAVTKTNRRRSHRMESVAVALLQSLAALPNAPIGLSPRVYRRRLKSAAEAAGITWRDILLRHSYGTYRLAMLKHAAQVAEEMGNSPAVVRAHYANRCSQEAAAAYWQIMPTTTPGNIVTFNSTPEAVA